MADRVKRYITDPTLLGQCSVKELNKQFFLPISDSEYENLTNRLFAVFENSLSTESEEISDLFLADYRFLFLILNYVAGTLAEKRCEKAGVTICANPEYTRSVNVDWGKQSRWFSENQYQESYLRLVLRDLYHTALINLGQLRNSERPFGIARKATTMGAQWRIKSDYMAYSQNFALQKEALRFVRSVGKSSEPTSSAEGLSTIDRVLDVVGSSFPDECGAICFEHIRSAWRQRLSDVGILYSWLRALKTKPETLLVSGGTNPFRKVAVLAFQREGVDTKVFYHGNDFGARITRNGHRGEVSHCQKFYCPTETICATYERNYGENVTEKRYGTKYFSVYQPGSDRFLAYKRVETRKTVSKVLLLGRPLNFFRITDARLSHFIQKVNLDLNLIQILNSLNFTVLYKPHPEWTHVANSLIHPRDATIVEGAFEDHWEKADVCIFTTVTSTTFGYALSTNLPIVLLDPVGNEWDMTMRQLVRARCALVQIGENDEGRVTLDKEAISLAITNCISKAKDRELFDTVFLGKNR